MGWAKRFSSSLFYITALLLSTGCVSIPDTHFTVEQSGSICSTNGECLCENSVLPHGFLDMADRTEGLDPEQITLLNWNSHKETSNQWLEELRNLIPGVDLLTLQEAAMGNDLRDLLDDEYSGGWILASAFTQSDLHTGVLTAARVRPDFFCSYRIAEPIIVVPKTVLITRYPIANSKQFLLLANLHMVNFSLATKAYREQLSKAFELIRQHQGPLLIAGDFNSWSNGRQTMMEYFANALGTDDVQLDQDNRTTFRGHVLDHIFYRGLELLDANSKLGTVSDHNPIRAAFRVADNPFMMSTSK